VGGLLGAIAGYGSRRVDDVIMRVMDIFLAIPSILLSIALTLSVRMFAAWRASRR